MSTGSMSEGTPSEVSSNYSDWTILKSSEPEYEPPVKNSKIVNITNWGCLVGKLLYCQVMNFWAITHQLTVKRRWEKAQQGGLWVRMKGRARAVVDQALTLSKGVAKEEDVLHSEWRSEGLLTYLFGGEYSDTLMLLAKAGRKLFLAQPMVVEAAAPCKIFGDLHGQLRDLLMHWSVFGAPSEHGNLSFVFNGDFVDRGAHQIETIGVLLAMKVLMPERVWLVRGNHEDQAMNEKYGFMDQCVERLPAGFGQKVFELMQEAFDVLPMACIVSRRILVVHGGIGNGRWDVNDLRAVRRPVRLDHGWLFNILWSDPIDDEDPMNNGLSGVHPSPRTGTAVQFGWNVTKMFCAKNNLSLVVRSHQVKNQGFGFEVMHENHIFRVFSARDYEGHSNDGAVLSVRLCQRNGVTSILSIRAQVLSSVTKLRSEPETIVHKLSDRKRRSSVQK